MSKRIFTEEQITMLLQNSNVAGCSPKAITYRQEFKVLAMRKHHEGLPPTEIFRQAKFSIDIIGRNTPKRCLNRWKTILKDKGEAGLQTDGRGGRRQSKPRGRSKDLGNLTNEEKLIYLEAEVAYLKEENRFLSTLRKKSLN